jgi:CBS domain-containing protein
MKISDVMSRDIVTATPDMALKDALELMVRHGVSGLPVVNPDGTLIGIMTEGDLLRRAEIGTAGECPGWLACLFAPGRSALDYVRSHARKIEELMTHEVITIAAGDSLADAIALMQAHRIKRLPVVENGRLIGIVSRADVLRTLLTKLSGVPAVSATDAEILGRIRAEISRHRWLPRLNIDLNVKDGVVELLGVISDERERTALRVIAENTPGTKGVRDRLVCVEPLSGAVIDYPA